MDTMLSEENQKIDAILNRTHSLLSSNGYHLLSSSRYPLLSSNSFIDALKKMNPRISYLNKIFTKK